MWKNLLFIHALLLLFCSCAGPSDPFGAINFLDDNNKVQLDREDLDLVPEFSPPKLSFSPSKQVLHSESDFGITIVDSTPIPDTYEVKLFYNETDITSKYLRSTKINKSNDLKSLNIQFEGLKLLPTKDHQITVAYRSSKIFPYSYFSYNAPTCDMNEIRPVREVASFDPSTKLIKIIEKESRKRKLNPSFLTALVAQESSFDPHAVSWAKAIGLTQVTNLASEHVTNRYRNWPENELVGELNFYQVKQQIRDGVINKNNDWRLDPSKSIIGGIYYISYLKKYWSKNQDLIDDIFAESAPTEDLILASYNSGAYRVKKSLNANKKSWLGDKSLREAKKYVNKIKSYCYHFSGETNTEDK